MNCGFFLILLSSTLISAQQTGGSCKFVKTVDKFDSKRTISERHDELGLKENCTQTCIEHKAYPCVAYASPPDGKGPCFLFGTFYENAKIIAVQDSNLVLFEWFCDNDFVNRNICTFVRTHRNIVPDAQMAATTAVFPGTTTRVESCRSFCSAEFQIKDCQAFSVNKENALINRCFIYTAIQTEAIETGGEADLYQLTCQQKGFDKNGITDDKNETDWGYGPNNGPHTWPDTCQTGLKQSPINFDVGRLSINCSIYPFDFSGYNMPISDASLKNNGHSIHLLLPNGTKPILSGGGLIGKYELNQISFHWSRQDNTGSEHTVGQLHYPLEMHLVHMLTQSTTDEWVDRPIFAIVAVLFKLTPNENEGNDGLELISSLFPNVITPNEPAIFKMSQNITIAMLLPKNVYPFYRYMGSLTTPPCSEMAVWTVLTEPVPVSVKQLQAFRQLQQKKGELYEKNYRPVQYWNGRQVTLVQTKCGCPNIVEQLGMITTLQGVKERM